MRYPYSRARQGLYALGVAMMVGFGLFLVVLGFDLMDSIAVPGGSSRGMRRAARRANTFSLLVIIGGAVTAIMAAKPGQVLYASTKAGVEIDDDGITYVGTAGSGQARWREVRKVSVDDFSGQLEIKVQQDILVIPKEFENWDDLVAQAKSRAPKSS